MLPDAGAIPWTWCYLNWGFHGCAMNRGEIRMQMSVQIEWKCTRRTFLTTVLSTRNVWIMQESQDTCDLIVLIFTEFFHKLPLYCYTNNRDNLHSSVRHSTSLAGATMTAPQKRCADMLRSRGTGCFINLEYLQYSSKGVSNKWVKRFE